MKARVKCRDSLKTFLLPVLVLPFSYGPQTPLGTDNMPALPVLDGAANRLLSSVPLHGLLAKDCSAHSAPRQEGTLSLMVDPLLEIAGVALFFYLISHWLYLPEWFEIIVSDFILIALFIVLISYTFGDSLPS